MPKAKKDKKSTAKKEKAPSKKPYILCPDTLEKVWITTVTLTDIKKAARTGEAPNKRRELLRIPSKQNRLAIYTEAAHAIENKELECMALYGGRPWTVTARVTEPKNQKPPLFRWFRGQLELATLPHLLEKIPDPPRLKGNQEYMEEVVYVPSTSLEERAVSSLSTVAWEDREYAIPTVSIKWLSPDHVYFYSRKSAWEHQDQLAEQQLFIQRIIHGLGFRGQKLKPFRPSRNDAMKAGKWRFLRDGLWVVGQEESWQVERAEWWLEEEDRKEAVQAAMGSKVEAVETASDQDSKPAAKRSLTGLNCFLREERHKYREEKNKERKLALGDSLEPILNMTLKEAETELRDVWKTLPSDEQNAWTERAKKENESKDVWDETASDADNKPAAKRSLTGLNFFLREERHKYREENNKERKLAQGDSVEPFPNMTLKQAETELRNVWKTLPSDEQNAWAERARRENESNDAGNKTGSEQNSKPAAKRALTGLNCPLREERHNYREEKNKERKLARGDSLEPFPIMTLKQAETELRNVWKTLPSDEQNAWTERTKRENESSDEGDEAKTEAAVAPTDSDEEVVASNDNVNAQHSQSVPLVLDDSKEDAALSTFSSPSLAHVSPSPPTAPTSEDERPPGDAALVPDSKFIPEGKVIALSAVPKKQSVATNLESNLTTDTVLAPGSKVLSESVHVASSMTSTATDSLVGSSNPTSCDESVASMGGTDKVTSHFTGVGKTEASSAPQPDKKRRKSVPLPPKRIVPSTQYRMTPEQIELCHTATTKHFKTVMNTVKARALHSELQDGFDLLRERGRGRYDMELPEFDSPEFNFLTDLQSAAWMPIVRAVLGDDVILIHKGAFLSMPGAEAQVYHQDGPHLSKQTQRPCHAVNVFIPLVDLHSRNGPTEFCLGTHVLGHEDYVKERIFTPQVPAGTPVMFDYRLGHRGLANSSSSCRPIVYCTYAAAANGKEFRDSVNFSRKRYHKIGELVKEAPSREERAAKRRKRESKVERERIEIAVRESESDSAPTHPGGGSEATAPTQLALEGGLEARAMQPSSAAAPESEPEATTAIQSVASEGTTPVGNDGENEAEEDLPPPLTIRQLLATQQQRGVMYPGVPPQLDFVTNPALVAAAAYAQSLRLGQRNPFDLFQQGRAQDHQGYPPYRNPYGNNGM